MQLFRLDDSTIMRDGYSNNPWKIKISIVNSRQYASLHKNIIQLHGQLLEGTHMYQG